MALIKDMLMGSTLHKLNTLKEKLPNDDDNYRNKLKEVQMQIAGEGVTGILFNYDDGILQSLIFENEMYTPALINSKLYLKHGNDTQSITDFITSVKKSQQLSLLSCSVDNDQEG
jgi:hypothetical protein